ncbi:MAG: hypothetical protein V1495_06430 [Pseudomonadota bacterium]
MRLRHYGIGVLVAAAAGAATCAKSGSSLSGILVSTDSAKTVPSKPTIGITGKNQAAIRVDFDTAGTTSQSLALRVSGLTQGEIYLFRVSDPSLDPVTSFPFKNDGSEALQLAAVPVGTVQSIKENVVPHFIPAIDSNLGVVMGQVDPTGGQGKCAAIAAVQLLNAADGSPATADAPIYFDNDGVPKTGGMGDRQCSYIIFNVPAGSYRIKFTGQSLNLVGQHDVLVAGGGEIDFGLGIP